MHQLLLLLLPDTLLLLLLRLLLVPAAVLLLLLPRRHACWVVPVIAAKHVSHTALDELLLRGSTRPLCLLGSCSCDGPRRRCNRLLLLLLSITVIGEVHNLYINLLLLLLWWQQRQYIL